MSINTSEDRRATVTVLLSSTLERLANQPFDKLEASNEKNTHSTLGELLDALDERAFGMMLLILALPCCIPFLYGIPQIVALPMLALAGQLAMGRHDPWLPKSLSERKFEIEGMKTVVSRASRYLGWLEKISHPRLLFLTRGVSTRIIGALLLIPTASILVPAPLTNSTPGIGISIAAVGLIERDGLLLLLGLTIGLVWVCLLAGAVFIFGPEGINILKDSIKALLGL